MSDPIFQNPGMVVLLPYATPHKNFQRWSVFHPAGLLMNSKAIDERVDYTGYSAVKFASQLSNTVIATIPPKTTIVGMALDQLLSSFVNPENILAEVERLEHEEDSIASQVKRVFDEFSNVKSVCVIWPYQIFNANALAAAIKADFAYSHPLLKAKRDAIPECLVINTSGNVPETEEMKDIVALEGLDPLLKGSYTRVLSLVEIGRADFEEFIASPDYPNLAPFLKKTLAGKQGILVNPQGHAFV